MAIPAPRWLLILGWIFAFLGGIIGLLIGINLRSAKIVDLDGKKVPRYDQSSRTQGTIIMIISIVMIFFWLFLRIATDHG